MVIDQHVFCLMDHCKKIRANVVYVIPELSLSRSAKSAFPAVIEIESAKKATILSGLADYGLLIIPLSENTSVVASESCVW